MSLDAGDPPRPPLVAVEGLSFGMTPEEVTAAWGPPEGDSEGLFVSYPARAGYDSAQVLYNWVDAELAPLGAPAGADTVRVLTSVIFGGGEGHPKATLREDLVARFGEPLSDPVLYRERRCEPPACEIWRPAELVAVVASWLPAVPELDYPERLSQLTYGLQPTEMVRHVPRDRWEEIRGEVQTSQPPEMRESVGEFSSLDDGTTVREIVEAIGKPNLVLQDDEGHERLVYLFLDGTMWTVTTAEGHYRSSQGSYRNE